MYHCPTVARIYYHLSDTITISYILYITIVDSRRATHKFCVLYSYKIEFLANHNIGMLFVGGFAKLAMNAGKKSISTRMVQVIPSGDSWAYDEDE